MENIGTKRILVIEDNELNRKLVRSLLKLGKYQVLEAVNAEEGIQLIREAKPDLVLMDIQLPGMDGLSATRVIKEDPALRHIPVLAFTAHAMENDRQKASEAGCDGYISKPIDTRNFLGVITKFLMDDGREKELTNGKNISHKNKILIVDDEPLCVKLLEAKLSGEKYTTIKAYNGDEALEKAYNEDPDLILLDIMMPKMNGYEVTRRLKSNPKTKNIPIILVTALNSTDDKVKGMEAGADEFLNKPVATVELFARVNSLIRLKEYREQLATRIHSEKFFIAPGNKNGSTQERKDLPSILLVENNEKDAKLVLSYLAGEPYQIELVSNGEEALARATKGKIDLILLDILLPGIDGFEVCRGLKAVEQTRNIQIIILTCLEDIEYKIKGIELGADDFLIKPINIGELRARIKALLKKKNYMDKLNFNYKTALHFAITDELTGLYNHAYFNHFLDLEVKRSERHKHSLALIMMDIDDFKKYNDTLGHLSGDRILKEFGQLIKKTAREIDLSARYGGEEFAIILPYADRNHAVQFAERINQVISTYPFQSEGIMLSGKITVSIGIAIFPSDALNSKELIRKADEMLYKAKKEGKNKICFN